MRAQLRRLAPFLRPSRRELAAGSLCALGGLALSLGYPQLARLVVDEGIGGGALDRVLELSALLFALLLLDAPLTWLRIQAFELAGWRSVARLREALLGNLLAQEAAFHDRETAADLAARLEIDTQQLRALVAHMLPEALRFSLAGAGALALLLYTSPLLSALILLVAPAIAFATARIGHAIQRRTAALREADARAHAAAQETLAALRSVRAHAEEASELARYRSLVQRSVAAGRRLVRSQALLEAATGLASEASLLVGIGAGGALVAAGRLSAGSLVSFLFYAGLVVRAFRNLSRVASGLAQSHAALDRVFALLERESRMPLSGGLRPARALGRLELEDVWFRYPTRPEAPVLCGLSFALEPGEHVALVGASGAGKSSVLALLARFYDPERGALRFDGRDLRELDPSWLRAQLLLVAQDAALFSRSLRENLLLGRAQPPPAQLDAALRAAQAEPFLARLPQGLETPAGDRGLAFSAGQRQRLALARALLREPRVLLLDEATSALDAETEAGLKAALRKLASAPAVLCVAHRLSSVADADRVLLLAGGRLAASGRHEELLRRSAAYRELVETQLVSE